MGSGLLGMLSGIQPPLHSVCVACAMAVAGLRRHAAWLRTVDVVPSEVQAWVF